MRSEIEQRCEKYYRNVYRGPGWIGIKSWSAWLVVLMAMCCAMSLYLFFSNLPSPEENLYEKVEIYLVLVFWVFFLKAQDRARLDSRARIVELIGRQVGVVTSDYDDARRLLLANVFNVEPQKFIEKAGELRQVAELKAMGGAGVDTGWLTSVRLIYDPSSKPRLLALLALAVAVYVGFMRSGDLGPEDFFSIVQDGYVKFVVVVTFVVSILLFMLSRFWNLIEILASWCDRSSSPNTVLIKVIGDLVALSKVKRGGEIEGAVEDPLRV